MFKKVLPGLIVIGIIIFAMFFTTLFTPSEPTELTFSIQADFYNQLVYAPEGHACYTNLENCDVSDYYLGEFQIAGEQIAEPQTVPVEGYGFILPPTAVQTWPVIEGMILIPIVVSWYDPFTEQSKKVAQTVSLNAALVKRVLNNNELGVIIYLNDAFGPEISINPKNYPRPTFKEQLDSLGSPTAGHGRFTLGRASVEINILSTDEEVLMRKAYLETQVKNID